MGVHKKGENWFIDYRANGRRIREKVGPSKKLAESVLSKRQLEIAEGKFLDIRKEAGQLFSKFAKQYFTWAKGRLRDAKGEEGLTRQLETTFGPMRLGELDLRKVEDYMARRLTERKAHPYRGRSILRMTPDELKRKIETWNARHTETVSKATINREVACMRRILNKAVDWKALPYNPIERIKLYDEREFIRKRYLKPEEVKELLASCGPRTRDIVTVALYTGRRQDEILGMRWQEVDLENSYVYFPDTKKKEPDQVPMPPQVRKALEAIKKRRFSEFVFCNRSGTRLGDIRNGFERALRRAKIKDFHFHDLRHTAISYMIMNGVDLKTVAELVGHTTAQMIDKRYGHLSPNHKRVATEIFGSAMDRVSGVEKRASKAPTKALRLKDYVAS